MLIEFRFKNYRSFRDETTLSMEATGLGTFKNSLIPYGSMNLLPGAAIFGKNGGGKIINMASIAGQVGGVFTEATYPVSKAGVICLAKAVAKQVGKDNITCNCIAPGTVLTAMTETLGSADASLNVPLHRLGNVRDIANAALFLASNESDFITGATIDVNGGMGMR